MKAKLLTDKICPDFLYHVVEINKEAGTIRLGWTTRRWNYNEVTFQLTDVELYTDDGEKING